VDASAIAEVEECPASSRSVVAAAGNWLPNRRCEAAHPQPATAAARRTTAANNNRFDRNIAPPPAADSDFHAASTYHYRQRPIAELHEELAQWPQRRLLQQPAEGLGAE
jgi:hypothetical protein